MCVGVVLQVGYVSNGHLRLGADHTCGFSVHFFFFNLLQSSWVTYALTQRRERGTHAQAVNEDTTSDERTAQSCRPHVFLRGRGDRERGGRVSIIPLSTSLACAPYAEFTIPASQPAGIRTYDGEDVDPYTYKHRYERNGKLLASGHAYTPSHRDKESLHNHDEKRTPGGGAKRPQTHTHTHI